jgi:serine/threonine protein kinase
LTTLDGEDLQSLVIERCWKDLRSFVTDGYVDCDFVAIGARKLLLWRVVSHRRSPNIIVIHIGSGLRLIHRLNAVYRDLKTANIGIGYDGIAKLFDLGEMKYCGRREINDCMNNDYCAPEMRNDDRAILFHSTANDVTMFVAMAALQMFRFDKREAGVLWPQLHNFEGEERKVVVEEVLARVPLVLRAVFRKCLAPHPDERPSIDEVLTILRRVECNNLYLHKIVVC